MRSNCFWHWIESGGSRWHRKPLWEIATLKPAYVGLQLGDFLWNEFVRHVTFWWLKFNTLISKRLKHVPWPQIASRTNFTNKLRHTKSLRLTVWTPITSGKQRSNIRLEEFDIQTQKSNMHFQLDLSLRIPFKLFQAWIQCFPLLFIDSIAR